MKTTSLAFIAPIVALGAAAPQKRDKTSTCEYYKVFDTPSYAVSNWVEEDYLPETADQCLTLDSYTDETVSYYANFTYSPAADWSLGYPNARVKGLGQATLEDHESITTSWDWGMDGTDVKASVNYILNGNSDCINDFPTWSMSIWLGTFGDLEPNDGTGKTGALVDVADIAGVGFDVYKITDPVGWPTVMWVFQAHENQTSFTGDIVEFLKWVEENYQVALGCLWGVAAGADIYGGTGGTFTTSEFSAKQSLRPEGN